MKHRVHEISFRIHSRTRSKEANGRTRSVDFSSRRCRRRNFSYAPAALQQPPPPAAGKRKQERLHVRVYIRMCRAYRVEEIDLRAVDTRTYIHIHVYTELGTDCKRRRRRSPHSRQKTLLTRYGQAEIRTSGEERERLYRA